MRSLVWALFILCVMAAVTATAVAETRLLGPPAATVTAEQTEAANVAQRDAMTEACSMPLSQSDVCADMATRVTQQQICAQMQQAAVDLATCGSSSPTPTPCPGYDARVPPPDACPPATRTQQ
jgi:hypothetical protein